MHSFPNTPIWILEYALNNENLATTQEFFNASLAYLDSLDLVERYAYFGSFRSSASGVGPNVAMLDSSGSLTDMGRWYLGQSKGSKSGGSGSGSKSSASTLLAWNFRDLTIASICVWVAMLFRLHGF